MMAAPAAARAAVLPPRLAVTARAAAGVDWTACVKWLIHVQMLPNDHQLTSSDESTQLDLGQTLRDGVLLCLLLNRLKPDSVDPRLFSQRPQHSQYLSKKNIRVFLSTCRQKFSLKEADLFHVEDLHDLRDISKVVEALSALSHSAECRTRGFRPFDARTGSNRPSPSTNYYPMGNVIRTQTSTDDDDDYDDNDDDDDYFNMNEVGGDAPIYYKQLQITEENIYGLIMNIVASELSTPPVSPTRTAAKTKREMCLDEIVNTEKAYVEVLNRIEEKFMTRLKDVMKPADFILIFDCIDELHQIHGKFYADLALAVSSNDVRGPRSVKNKTVSDCFIEYKEKFLIYGRYCSNVSAAQERLNHLSHTDQNFQNLLNKCQTEPSGTVNGKNGTSRFTLHDSLTVPVQRVLKYHLLLTQLIRDTPQSDMSERSSLQKALDETLDLAEYINEVKRDDEMLKSINGIENSIKGLNLPPNTHLSDYGKLQEDGEVKIKQYTTISRSSNKLHSRYAFLFDKVMLICKCKGETYTYEDHMVLKDFDLVSQNVGDEPGGGGSFNFESKWTDRPQKKIALIVKSPTHCQKWSESLARAQENRTPPDAMSNNHQFGMRTFQEVSICDVCRKLLKGTLFQGYECRLTRMKAHKECISKARDINGPPTRALLPRKSIAEPSHSNSASDISGVAVSPPISPAIAKVEAVADYEGRMSVIPPPTSQLIRFRKGDVFDLIKKTTEDWWEGRIFNTGSGEAVQGFFPRIYVKIARHICSGPPVPIIPARESTRRPSVPVGTPSACGGGPPAPPRPPKRENSQTSEGSRSLVGQTSVRRSESEGSKNSGGGRNAGFTVVRSSDSDINPMSLLPWYVGYMKRDEASQKLEPLPNGAFLVRISPDGNRRGHHALSVKYQVVQHIEIHERETDGAFYVVQDEVFKTIQDLISHYEANSMFKDFREVATALTLPYCTYTTAQRQQ